MASLTLRESRAKRLEGLKTIRQPYEAEWLEIARLAAPSRTRFLNSDTNRNAKRKGRVYDEHGIYAFRTLTGGMASGLSSESRPWFNLELADRDLMDQPEVRAWLDDTETRLYDFIARTNFYSAAKVGYSEMGLFGTEGCVMVADRELGAVCHPLTVGEYWIGLSASLQPDTLYRRLSMTTAQAVTRFGGAVRPQVRTAYDNGDYDKPVEVIHAIEPRRERDTNRLDARNMPWSSVYWDEADDRKDHVLRESGYKQQPFWAARWDTIGADAYGQSPGMDALPSLRELQLLAKRQGEAVDFLIKPEKIVPTNVKLTGQAGNIVAAASVDKDAVSVPYQVPFQLPALIGEIANGRKDAINQASYADLFLSITNMQGIQPRNIEEIAARNEEKLTQLGPVVGNVNKEKLSIGLDIAFSIMSDGGLLMPAPEALQGVELKFAFISILTQMQRAIGLGQIERTASFVGNLAAVFPTAVDKLNTDQMIDEYAERAGAPQRMVRSEDEVAEIRGQRAQAEQAQKAAEMMPAVQQGADAARLLSETDTGGGQSLLQSLMPA